MTNELFRLDVNESKAIRGYRIRENLSQDELASRLNVDKTQIEAW